MLSVLQIFVFQKQLQRVKKPVPCQQPSGSNHKQKFRQTGDRLIESRQVPAEPAEIQSIYGRLYSKL